MSLESALALFKNGVTDVTGVTASNGAASSGYPGKKSEVTEVTGSEERAAAVTPVTPGYPIGVTAKPYQNQSGYPGYPGYPKNNQSEPPPLTSDERADIREARLERAAIMEFDGGLSRVETDAKARRAVQVYRVQVDVGTDREPKWAFMLGCNGMGEAKRTANNQFGADRVLAVVEQGA